MELARAKIEAAIIDAGYAVVRGTKRVPSRGCPQPDVSVSLNRQGPDGLVFVIGVNANLPEEVRSSMWKSHGRQIVERLQRGGFTLDLDSFGTRRDWRVFVVQV